MNGDKKNITVSFPISLILEVEKLAKVEYSSISAIIRKAVNEYINSRTEIQKN